MLPYLLMFSSILVHYFEGASMKIYNRKHTKGGFMFISIVSFFSALFFLLKYLFLDSNKADFTTLVIPYGIIGGIMYAASSVLVFYAIQVGSLAVTQVILGYATIVSTLFGIIVLKEKTNFLTYVGILIFIVAIFLLKKPSEKGENAKKATLAWFLLALFGMLASSGYGIASKLQQIRFKNTVDNEFAMIAIGFSFLANFVLSIIIEKKHAFYVLKTCLPYASVAGISNGLTNAIVFIYNPMIEYSIAVPTKSLMGKTFHFVMGKYILKEQYSKAQIIGLVLVCIAVILMNLVKFI